MQRGSVRGGSPSSAGGERFHYPGSSRARATATRAVELDGRAGIRHERFRSRSPTVLTSPDRRTSGTKVGGLRCLQRGGGCTS
jgi:hypothetical protein